MPTQRHISWKHISWKGRLAAVATVSAAGSMVAGPMASAATPEPAGSSYTATADPYSLAAVEASIGAPAWWAQGHAGAGVDVAVIDTGVAPVAGLGAGQVVTGPDLSVESQDPAIGGIDTNGHGTFMAGLIAGNDPASGYRGVAPGARVVSLKVAAANGAVDVTQVVAAIDWVVAHRADNGMNIRVINLSYGTWSTSRNANDALRYAAEQAYEAGILLVAAAGNVTGPQTPGQGSGLVDPAVDPTTLAVGAADTNGTTAHGDDGVAPYSATGTGGGARQPDLLTPGSHLQGLRVAGSSIDDAHPDARLGTQFFRGSGTSEATAIASGAAALVFSAYPSASPDQVKAYLESAASPLTGASPRTEGAGELDLAALAGVAPSTNVTPAATPARNGGSLDAARGGAHLASPLDDHLSGDNDIFGRPFHAGTARWSGDTFNGSTWIGAWPTAWDGSSWTGFSGAGKVWKGTSWSGTSWSGTSWSGTSWSGTSWRGTSWSGTSWSSASWG